MIFFAHILFWFSAFLLVYHYVFFPLILKILAASKKEDFAKYTENEFPKVAILLAAYNEEKVIEKKIQSTFDTQYPLDKITFYIGSDSSTDATDSIVNKYQEKFPQLVFRHFFARTGKPEIINQLEKETDAEILVLTDANVFFEPNTLTNLVSYFKSPSIGLVGGNIINIETKKDGISNQEKAYLNAETKSKYYEGLLWGKMMGAFGGLYALRKNCYVPVPKGFIVDDFYISMKVIEADKKAINALDALAYEDVSNISSEEFRRKVRISIGNFQNLFAFKSLIFKDLTTFFCIVSHKVIRWIGPFLLLFQWVSALVLSLYSNVWVYILCLFSIFMLSPIFDLIFKKCGIHLKALRFFSHFILMNVALMIGFFKFTIGNYSQTWNPTQRNQ